MGNVVISVENLSKRYDLGVIGTGTISRDLNRWWARLRGQPDPYTKIGQIDHGNRQGESIWALKDVSFEVKQGEVLGIIGRNGAGKSTLLKILSQVTAPTGGLVKVKGRIGSLLEVGTGFHPELTGRENVYLNGAILGMTRAEVDRKFDEIVDFSGVEKFIDTPVKRYSSGMYVRLAFAVAAHLTTDILIVDEVLAVGDAEFQEKCLGKMGNVANEGRTVLFVSHNMGSIRNLCKRSIQLAKGEILRDGNTIDIVENYLFDSDHEISLNGKYIKAFEILNSLDQESKYILSGECTTLNILIDTGEDYLLNTNIRMGIYSRYGDRIATLEETYMKLKPQGPIKCQIDSLPLTPGLYFINIAINGYTNNGDVYHERVIHAGELNVLANPKYPYSNKQSPGNTFIKYRWSS